MNPSPRDVTLRMQDLTLLRHNLARFAPGPATPERVSLGLPDLDGLLGGGILRAGLHEVYAPGVADGAAATGFAAGLAVRAAGGRSILWVRQDFLDTETGWLHPPGLAELGLDPSRIVLVRARDAAGVLRAGAEAARCAALGATLIEPWGEPRLLDLTASRRLSLAAETSGVTTLLLRIGALPTPSAARTRWLVRSHPSMGLAANAPGDPAFTVALLRQRGGVAERAWLMEWNRDLRCFQERDERKTGAGDAAPVSLPVVPFPADRPAQAHRDQNHGRRRA